MRADPDTLAKTILGMPSTAKAGGAEDVSDDVEVDSEGAAIESAAADAASALGLPPEKASGLVAFAQTILRLAREA